MSTPENRIVVAIETLLRGMPKATRDLSAFEKRLRSLSDIKVSSKPISTAQIDKATLSAQRLQQQQQKLSIQAQELANRQERARQAADRLARSQQQLANQSARAAQQLGANANSHVRAFRAMQAQAKQAAAQVAKINAQTARQAAQQQRIQQQAARAIAQTQVTTARQMANALIQSLQQGRKAGIDLDRILNRIGGTLSRLGSGIASFGRTLSVALTAPLAALGAISVKSARDLDDQVNTLKAFTGSSEAAEQRLAQLIATAQKTPGLTTSLGLLLDAQLRVAEVTVETIDKISPAIGKLNAVSRLQDPQRFAQNMVQLVTQNFERIDLKELVGQSPLAGQIVKEMFNVDSPINAKAIRESAKKMGLTTTDAFFAAFAEAAGRNQALATITESISSRFGKAVDRVMIALRPLGLAIIDAITPAINALIPIIETLGKAFADLPKPAQQAILIFAGLAALLGPALVVIGTIVTSLGGLITALGAIAGVVATIGLPAIAAAIGGIVILIAEWVAILTALGLAWKTNFLNIRELVTDAARAVLDAFGRIKAVLEEAIQRILPTLQSITGKVIGAITDFWNKFGRDIVSVVRGAFEVTVRILEAGLRFLGNFVDLITKLIDGDWRGAWRAFARILVNAGDGFFHFFRAAGRAFVLGIKRLIDLVVEAAGRITEAAKTLAEKFINSLKIALIAGAPSVRDALVAMLALAVATIDPGTIAVDFVRRFIAALRRAAEENLGRPPSGGTDPEPSFVVGAGVLRKRRPGSPPEEDKKAANALRRAQDDLAKAENDFERQQAQSRLDEARAAIQQQFELTKDGLDRELNLLEGNFDDRLVAVRKYFEERRKLEESAIDAELTKEKALSASLADEFAERRKQIEREFKASVVEINRDPNLKGRAKEVALKTAEVEKQTALAQALNQFETENAAVSTRILLLQKQRKDVAVDLGRAAANLLKDLQQQETELRAQLFEEQGQTADAAGIRLRRRFKDTLEELRIDIRSLPPELQAALNSVDLKSLKSRLAELPEPIRDLIALLDIAANQAVLAEQSVRIDRTLSELRLREVEIQNKVLDGVLSERDARAQIAGLQQVTKARLQDILAAQLKIAESTAGQEDEVLRLRQQIQEIERLGQVIDEVGQQINQELFSNIEQGFEGIFQNARRGFEGLKDAAISFGESMLSTLNKIAAQGLTDKLRDVFKIDAETTEGTPGGFFAKLFGLGPKPADTAGAAATLSTAATTAGAALTTGGTTAATALTTGGTAASTAIATGVAAAAASFTAAVTAAGAAFAATVAAAASTQSVGGLGGAFQAAEGGLFSARPGGRLGIFAEAGYPEAVLTTDPKHASRQFAILQRYLKETRGLFGRIPQHIIPRFEAGDFISPRQTEASLLSSITRTPSPITTIPVNALATAGGKRETRMRFVFVDERSMRDWINSPEGEEVFVQKLTKNRALIRRF